jgi:hypothetical protein
MSGWPAKVKARLAADPTYEKRTMLQKHWLESLTSPSLDEWFEKDLWPAVEPGKAGSGAGPLLGLDCSAG